MLAKMARADGQVTRHEIDLVTKFMEEELGLDDDAREYAVKIFRAAKDSPTPFEEFAGQFRELFAHEPRMRSAILDLLVRLAMADGHLAPAERELLQSAASILEVSLSGFDHLVGQHAPDFERHYHTLGVEPGVDFAAVRSAYRKLVSEIHPDKVIGKGLPDEFVRYAEQRFREVQEAYEAIRAREAA
jgi:DnaJ like chaperone protein